MKKKVGCLSILIFLFLFITAIILFWGFGIPDCGRSEKSERKRIKELTGIEIPIESEMLETF